MGSKPFQFKYFSVTQEHCTHKVGTDGVLLGAWVNITGRENCILDIGTGSGLIALMLAQRTNGKTQIDAVDIDAGNVRHAAENIRQSPWPEKIKVHHTPIQNFFPARKYDLIISNPPYFERSLLPPDEKRTLARHTGTLPFEELLSNTIRLLSDKGRFAVILPAAGALKFTALARTEQLQVLRRTSFRSKPHKPWERLLIEFSRTVTSAEESGLTLYDQNNEWSTDYSTLTREFYLKI